MRSTEQDGKTVAKREVLAQKTLLYKLTNSAHSVRASRPCYTLIIILLVRVVVAPALALNLCFLDMQSPFQLFIHKTKPILSLIDCAVHVSTMPHQRTMAVGCARHNL